MDNKPRDEQNIYDWLSYYIATYRDNPAIYKLNCKPLIAVWASSSVPDNEWRRIFAKLKANKLEAMFIGQGYNGEALAAFDGIHEYGANQTDLAQYENFGAKIAHNYPLLSDSQLAPLYVATVSPGYDERRLKGSNRSGRYIDRKNGEVYRNSFDWAIKSNPNFIFLTSWNEWWENTHIQPSQKYGDKYLLAKQLSDKWKAGNNF